MSYVIWPLVAGTTPTASSLDAVVPLEYVLACALRPLAPAMVLTCMAMDSAPCGPRCMSLSLVASQHIHTYHWDKPTLLSLFHAVLQPQG